jgi:hypothetical protein
MLAIYNELSNTPVSFMQLYQIVEYYYFYHLH